MDNSLNKLLLQFLQQVDELLISREYVKEILFGDAERLANKKAYKKMKSKFHLMGKNLMQQGLIHSYDIIEVASDSQSAGMKLKDNNNNILISLDVRMSNLYFGLTTSDVKITLCDSYHIDYLLSNKLLSVVSEEIKNARDLYDVYLLTEYLGINPNCIEQNKLPFTDKDLVNYIHTWRQDNTLKTFDFRKSLERLYYLLAPRDIDKEIKSKAVICGDCLLEELLYAFPSTHLDLFTEYKELDDLYLFIISYHYNPNIDYTNFVRPMETNPNILLPSPERAIIECIKFIDNVVEDILIEAIQNYKLWYKGYDKLYPMADFYKLPKEELDHWIYEAENDYEEW